MSSPAAVAQRGEGPWAARLAAVVPKLVYGCKLAAAVSLALFVAFALELDNPSWAGTSAAVVCQPILGASLRKGFFRVVGTIAGAAMSVVLIGLFPQDRVGFLVGMALWAAACSFGNTLARNFSAYAFALSGYTLAIIAGDAISEPDQAFHLAVTRATEIVIGIACAMAVTGLSETGRSGARLAGSIDALGGEILSRFGSLMRDPARHIGAGPSIRRSLIARVAALDPVIDQAIGEEPELRQRAAILHDAVAGLFSALSGWRIAESHLVHLSAEHAARSVRPIADRLPDAWGAGPSAAPAADRRLDRAAARSLADLKPEGDVSQRLLADAAARLALGLGAAANGLALLRDPADARDPSHVPGAVVADVLPALVNALRTFVAVLAGIAFWILTEWPSGLGAVTFLTVTVLLLAPLQERSAKAALGFGLGTVLTAVLAAVIDFALLPNHESFLALAAILSCFLVPLAALSTVPALAPYFVAATMNLVPLVGPTNQITFDTLAFYNSALGIVGGCLAGALALVLIPPVPKLTRADRLVELSLGDLRRMASGRRSPTPEAWQARVHARLIAMPEGVDPVHGSRLVAVLSMGLQVLRLRSLAGGDAAGDRLRAALNRLAGRDVDGMLTAFDALDAEPAGWTDLRVPTALQVMRDVVRQHRHEFEEG